MAPTIPVKSVIKNRVTPTESFKSDPVTPIAIAIATIANSDRKNDSTDLRYSNESFISIL